MLANAGESEAGALACTGSFMVLVFVVLVPGDMGCLLKLLACEAPWDDPSPDRTSC